MEIFKEFVNELAVESGALIREHWEKKSFSVSWKADKTVVTETDRAVEQLLRQRIMDKFPEHGIIGEEFGNHNEDADYVWILDPIDGTISYVHGIPLFGTLIGLLHKGLPILGCIHQPLLGELAIGDGETTTLNGQVVKVSNTEDFAAADMMITDPTRPKKHQDGEAWWAIADQAKIVRTWGDCYGYLLVATGRVDAMFDPVLSPWDLLPVIPVITGAGGVITDWQGKPAHEGASAIAANPKLHAKIMAELG